MVENKNKMERKVVIFRLFRYVAREWYLFIPAILITLLSNQLALMGPSYSGRAIDAIITADSGGLDAVWGCVFAMVVCYVAASVLSYILAVVMVHLSQRIVYRMRKQVFEKLNTLPVSFYDLHPTGDIISRISYDIDTINGTLSHDLVQVMTSIYTVLGSLVFMWHISKPMLLIFVITIPASILFTRFRSKKIRPLFRQRSRKLGELNGYAEEMLSGVRTIEAYGKGDVIGARFDKRNRDTMQAYYNAEYYGSTMGPTVNFINNFSLVMVAVFGGILYMLSQRGDVLVGTAFYITLGGIAQFVQYSRKFAGPINEFANIIHEFQSAFSAAERVFRILDEPAESADLPDAYALADVKGEVEISEVSFGYLPEQTVIKDLTLSVPRGRTVAIVGPTGAGKTTIINLLMRFYDPDSGEIRLDSLPTLSIKRRDLRLAYTMVLQDTWLFGGTIYENVIYGRENATEDDVRRVCRAVGIEDFIESLPEGYYTQLTDDGVNISKGQKQLLTIARAMLSDAPMLILDEATSNVDSRTELKIQAAMDALMQDRTAFVIAHRLSTVKNADTILVVRDGVIAEQGTHTELLALGGFYSTLYNSQFA